MATVTTSSGGTPLPAGCNPGCEIGPKLGSARQATALAIRTEAADHRGKQGDFADHPCNGDEVKYANKNFYASFTKGLPHHGGAPTVDVAGEVEANAYCLLLKAMTTGKPEDFDAIPHGCTPAAGSAASSKQTESRFAPGGTPRQAFAPAAGTPPKKDPMPFVNPQAALAYDMEGADSHQLKIAAAPTFASAEEAGEMIELYWMAMARDVPFARYGQEPITQAAIADLNKFAAAHPADFEWPTNTGGQADGQTLFRGKTAGETVGPYLSQFLLLDAPFGAQVIDQRINTVLPVVRPDGTPGAGMNYLTAWEPWLDVQNGCRPAGDLIDTLTRRYIRNGRDLGQYVHIDVLFQAYFNAMLILLQNPSAANSFTGLNAMFDAANPYVKDASGNPKPGGKNQDGFGTFGGPHIATLVCEVATRALKAVWYQKWTVHRRLRPEAFGGWVEKIRNSASMKSRYEVHDSLLTSDALVKVAAGIAPFPGYGTHLLPMAFPEGSPVHPAYGAGHATVAGACVTVLKAWFKEDMLFKDLMNQDEMPLNFKPVEPALTGAFPTDGVGLVQYTGPDANQLTVGGELNKLAANIGIGRNHAGVHWRSDHDQSIRLGEEIAISVLEDQACTYNEKFDTDIQFTFTRFDGTAKTIGRRPSCPALRS